MTNLTLYKKIGEKDSDKEAIAVQVIKNPELLSQVFEGLTSETANIKFGCDKVLRIISKISPSILYPKFDFLINQLDCSNNFLKWGAIHIITNLTSIDNENKFESIFEKYFAPIPGPAMITASNVIKGAAAIALAKPHLTEKITVELLKVEKAKYQTPECRNVALGHTINSFDIFFNQIKNKGPVIKFIKKQLNNDRSSTKKKAVEFLKKHAN